MALRSLPQDGRTVFVVNAPTMLSAPRFLESEWKLKVDIIFVDQFRGCARADQTNIKYDSSQISLSVEIPSCARYVFAGVPYQIQSKALAGNLVRPSIGTYEFPKHGNDVTAARDDDIKFGNILKLNFATVPQTILAYDWRNGAYRIFRFDLR